MVLNHCVITAMVWGHCSVIHFELEYESYTQYANRLGRMKEREQMNTRLKKREDPKHKGYKPAVQTILEQTSVLEYG